MKKVAKKSCCFLPEHPSALEVYQAGYEIIQSLLQRAKANFERNGKSLHYSEYIDKAFRVSAYRERPDGEEFYIKFSPSVPWTLFQGISAFVGMAANKFGGAEYSEIFGDVSGPNRIGILPEGWSILECRDAIFEKALVWLFHHELGHLLQDHERIRKNSAPEGVDITLFVDEAMSKSEALGPDTDLSWVYHATELAADHQALHYSIFYTNAEQVVASAKGVSSGSIWCFVCAVAYMFHYFYGNRPDTDISPVAEGSHPDPTIRLATLTRHLCQFFNWKSVRDVAPEAPTEEEAEMIATYAEVAIGMYWSLTFNDGKLELTKVLGRLERSRVDVLQYGVKLAKVWSELRLRIMETYFGENSSHVMEIAAPLGC